LDLTQAHQRLTCPYLPLIHDACVHGDALPAEIQNRANQNTACFKECSVLLHVLEHAEAAHMLHVVCLPSHVATWVHQDQMQSQSNEWLPMWLRVATTCKHVPVLSVKACV